MGEVAEDVVHNEDRMCWLTTSTHDPNSGHEMVSPLLDDVEWSRVGCMVI